MRYHIIGDDAAVSHFRIDETSGRISVSNNLENDATRDYTIRVEARDGGTPPRSDVTLVQVHVLRNMRAPAFEPVNYDSVIKETVVLGETIASVKAADADRRVSCCNFAKIAWGFRSSLCTTVM